MSQTTSAALVELISSRGHIARTLAIGMLASALALSGCATISPGETGMMWRPLSSGLSKKRLAPGLYVIAPWNDVVRYNTQLEAYKERVVVLTKDDLKIAVAASVIIRPIPEEVHQLETEIGQKFYPKVVQPKFRTSVRNVMAGYSMVEVSKNSRKIEAQLKSTLAQRLAGRHIHVHDVILDDIRFSQQVLSAIEQKVSKEQEQKQMRFQIAIAGQNANIVRIKANAEADATRARAKAQADAQKLIDTSLTARYLQYRAVSGPNAKFYFMPTGKHGLPIFFPAPTR